MSKLFDRRHRWGELIAQGATLTRTCRVCGRVVTYETLVPQGFVDYLVERVRQPNPYRDLFR